MNKTKLNQGSIASYDLRPGNGVVTILVEWDEKDESHESHLTQALENRDMARRKKSDPSKLKI